MKQRKRLSLFFLLLVLSYSQCYAEKVYTITQEQLEQLKSENEKQEKLLTEQEQQLKNLENQINEQEQYLKTLKKQEIKTCIVVGSVSFSVGLAAGILAYVGVTQWAH